MKRILLSLLAACALPFVAGGAEYDLWFEQTPAGGVGRERYSLADPAADYIVFWDKSANRAGRLTPTHSVTISGTGLQLVGDTASPGNDKYYGTNSSGVRGWYTLGAGSGSVTSVDVAVPSWLSVSGVPITTSGTITIAAATGQTANYVLATPNGSTGAVSLRALVAADIPSLTLAKISDAGTLAGLSAVGSSQITDGSVALADMANMATASLLGRNTGGTGAPEVLGASTVRTLLSINNVENTALTTWAGNTSITSVGTIGTGTWQGTQVGAVYGGTGQTTVTQGDLLYGGTNAWSKLAKSATATRYLSNTGTNNDPAWAQVNLTNGVTGALPIANGGTGQTTASAAFNALSPMTTAGDIIIGGSSGAGTRLAIGENGEVLQIVAGAVAWAALEGSGGDVTASSAFGTDNLLIRSDGTGKGVQASGISIDDSNNMSGVASISATGLTVSGGKMTIDGGATPSVTAFGELSSDNNLWAASRGAPVFYDGTAAVALLGVLVSDTPTNGQSPVWNNGGTITWETPATAVSAANPSGTIGLTAVNGSASTYMRSDGAPALSQAIAPTWTGVHTFSPTARSSGAAAFLTINAPSDTGLTASSEAIGVQFAGATRQHATGAITTQREYVFGAPTYSFVGSSTITNAATVAISGAPTAGTNATITNGYALWVQSGNALFSGLIRAGSTPVTLTDSAGLILSAALNTVAIANGGTGATTAGGAATALGVGTGDSPQFTGVNVGHASDTTIARVSAGVISVEGVTVSTDRLRTIDITADAQTDDTSTGTEVITGKNAGATIAQWEVVVLRSGVWQLADQDATTLHQGLIGLALTAGTSGNPLSVLVRGFVRNDGWTWTADQELFLSATPGAMTSTVPSTTGHKVRKLAVAITDDEVFFNGAVTDWATVE